jgi:hypothetical protein
MGAMVWSNYLKGSDFLEELDIRKEGNIKTDLKQTAQDKI